MPPETARPRRRRRSPGEWALLAEALPTLAAASLAIRILPFRTVAAAAARVGRGAVAQDPERVRQARLAVQAWARRVPWRAVCFQQGLALHLMLRRRGIASVLNYGVRKKEGDGLAAHVWVDVGSDTVIGGEEAPEFARLARFPAEAA
jgi:hypothetical protein